MPEPEKSMAYFAFSIATARGSTRGGLGDLIGGVTRAGITVHSLSGFVGQVRALLDNRMGEALEVGLTAGAVRSV
jgi:hypothetical protein